MEIDDFIQNNENAKRNLRFKKHTIRQPKKYLCLTCSAGFDEPVVQNKVLKIIVMIWLIIFGPFSFGITFALSIIFYICAFKKTCPYCKSNTIKKDKLH